MTDPSHRKPVTTRTHRPDWWAWIRLAATFAAGVVAGVVASAQ